MRMNQSRIAATTLLSAAVALGADYHVAARLPGADDANPGTLAQPWKTLTPANAQALVPGDRLLIHSGTYWGTLSFKDLQGTAEQPIRIEGVPDQGPVILKGSERFEGAWTRILDGTEKLVEPYPDAFRRRWVVDCPGPRVNQVVLSDQRFLQQIGPNAYSLDKSISYVRLPPVGETVEDMFRWTFFHDLEAEKLYIDIVGEPSWYLIDVGRGGTVIHLSGSRHVVIRNLDMRYGGNGISMMNGEHVTVEDVTAFGNIETGFSARLSRHVTLRRCRAVHNGYAGVVLAATHDCDVIETDIIENNYRSFHTGWGGGGSKNLKTVRTSFVNCLAARNNGPGIWFDIDCQDTRFIGNRIHHNSCGIHYEISFGNSVIANNLIYRNVESGVYLSCSSGTLVAHNTFVENGRGVAVAGGGRGFRVSEPPAIDVTDKGRIWEEAGGSDGKYPLSNNRVVNNLFVRNGTMGDRELQSRELLIEPETPLTSNNVSDANVFVGGWWPVRLAQTWNEQLDLAAWHEKTGRDAQSVIVDELPYTIDGDGLFTWRDPEAVARLIRICPPIQEAGPDRHGRERTGNRVQAGADTLPVTP